MNTTLTTGVLAALLLAAGAAQAKLPPPSDEAKAKAAEAAAKAAYGAKVDNYKTCLSAEKAAAHYFKTHPGAAKPTSAPACADPGPFVPPATANASGAPAAAAPAAPATPAAGAAPAPKAPAKKS